MTIETTLLLLESVLLIATIILLVYSIREGRQREHLLLEIGKATKILTRQEYFLSVLDSMINAKEEVSGCITGRVPSGDDKQMTTDIIDTLEGLTKRGVRSMYLMPKFPDRLYLGYLYTKAGAVVFYSSCLMVHNMRFMIVDDSSVIIGIPESVGEMQATKKGYRIPSEGLAMILKNYLDTCENKTSFTGYVNEVMQQTGASLQHIAREFQIDEEGLKELMKE
ncbi:MAG: hypothetical protein HZB61_00275 [Nitrospirae bacterium]|nr:hypothetical protein [Nitrospirota bacterium]